MDGLEQVMGYDSHGLRESRLYNGEGGWEDLMKDQPYNSSRDSGRGGRVRLEQHPYTAESKRVVYKLVIWIAEVQSSSVNGASSSVLVQARQSGSLGRDHPNSPYLLPAFFHMYGASVHWPYGNFSGTDAAGWNGVEGGDENDGQFDNLERLSFLCWVVLSYWVKLVAAKVPVIKSLAQFRLGGFLQVNIAIQRTSRHVEQHPDPARTPCAQPTADSHLGRPGIGQGINNATSSWLALLLAHQRVLSTM
ncbi:hypothetical protein B0H13DRAFT_1874550 [Mycena leptocephala]|nr:hypothetical protein B0H13DRAFT_1874550 [Mycena leptocephala]